MTTSATNVSIHVRGVQHEAQHAVDFVSVSVAVSVFVSACEYLYL